MSDNLASNKSFEVGFEIPFPYPLYRDRRGQQQEPVVPDARRHNEVSSVVLHGVRIVSLNMEGQERLCLAQISNTLLNDYSYNEIHNRRVALGITCVQCTPVQLEILRRAGAMPISSRRCGMITRREAERLCKSFLGDNTPPNLPENFAFEVYHECAWGCRGQFVPARYNSSRAKCIKCVYCGVYYSPNKFVFHSHRTENTTRYVQPDAANFNSWRRHTRLLGDPPEQIVHAWEDIKAMFNGGTRKRVPNNNSSSRSTSNKRSRSNKSGNNKVLSNEVVQSRVNNQEEQVWAAAAAAAASFWSNPFANPLFWSKSRLASASEEGLPSLSPLPWSGSLGSSSSSLVLAPRATSAFRPFEVKKEETGCAEVSTTVDNNDEAPKEPIHHEPKDFSICKIVAEDV